jgi:hypothetical protein
MSAGVNMDDALDSMSDCSDWSSSDDSDIDELLQENDMELMVVVLPGRELEDHAKLVDQRKGSQIGLLCIPRNRALSHEQLMQDYFRHTHHASSVPNAL